MKKILIRYISVVLTVFLLLSSVSVSAFEETEEDIVSTDSVTENFDRTIENDHYALKFYEHSADVAVLDKETGYIWRSNTQTDSENKEHLIVYYYDDGKLQSMDSYTDCMSFDDQMSWEVKDGRLIVSYHIASEIFSIDILPRVLSQKRMEEDILPLLTEDEQKTLLRRYKYYSRDEMDQNTLDTIKLNFPSIENSNLYILSNVPAYIGQEIYDLFLKTGYTMEDLENDCKENEIENTYREKPFFKISLEYSLTDDGLSVTVEPNNIGYSENYKPFRIDVLPYFGAADHSDEGYMLIPDGSGAVINFNNKKTAVQGYEKQFFLPDDALSRDETEPKNEASLLPVFAVSNSKGSFLATVDKGYEVGGIKAEICKDESSYNRVYTFFDLFPSDTVALSSSSLDTFILSSNDIFSSPITVTYRFTKGGLSYSKFAVKYREYLIENGILKDKNEDATELNISLITSATVTKRFLGIPYKSIAALTDYNEASVILNDFKDYETELTLINAMNGGRVQKSAEKLDFLSVLGSKKQRKELDALAGGLTVSYYAAHSAKLSKNNSAMTLSKKRAKLYGYDMISRYITSKDSMFLVSSKSFERFAEKIAKSLKKQEIDSVNILDIGYGLHSDFNTKASFDRHESRIETEKYLEKISETARLTIEKGSIYSLPFADKINNIPVSSSGYLIEDGSVPFYEIAISGYTAFVTEPVNSAANQTKQFLKTVELGGQLQYEWVYDLPDNIADGNEEYFDRIYGATKERAKSDVALYSGLYRKIYDQSIIEHTSISETLVKTVFENGISVYVNYSDEDVTVDGIAVKKQSFSYSEGERA